MDVFELRRDFTLKTLEEKDMDENPIAQFEKWFKDALQSHSVEPNAMVLSTATKEGKPSSRVVLLKEVRDSGFVFFTNYESYKSIQIHSNPYCALNFVWHELERQVRIEGAILRILPEESDKYFESRPEKSKLGAWASPQSKVIPNRDYLEGLMLDFTTQFRGKKIKRPANWGGFLVVPYMVEFWQGRSNRLHDRIRYKIVNNTWIMERLAP